MITYPGKPFRVLTHDMAKRRSFGLTKRGRYGYEVERGWLKVWIELSKSIVLEQTYPPGTWTLQIDEQRSATE